MKKLFCLFSILAATASAQIVHYVLPPEIGTLDGEHVGFTLYLLTSDIYESDPDSTYGRFAAQRSDSGINEGTGYIAIIAGGAVATYAHDTGSGSVTQAKPFGFGEEIAYLESSSSADIGTRFDASAWNYATSAYVGFHFGDGLGGSYVGWAEVTRTLDAITISELAYAPTSFGAFHAGQISAIPEPSTYATIAASLALGMAALRRYRHRRTPVD